MQTQDSKKRKFKKTKEAVDAYAKYSNIGMQMLAMILIGVFGGLKLDEWLENGVPVFTLIGSALSVFGAIYVVIKGLTNK